MTFKDLNILIISPDEWSFVQVSKHMYALELAKSNNVFFLNPPCNAETFVQNGVTVISDYLTIRGIGKIKNIWLQRYFMRKTIKSIHKNTKSKIDVVWSFDSSRLFYLDLFNAKIKIAHLVDFRENIHLDKLAKYSDICLGTSQSIINQLKLYNKKVFKIQHGYVDSEIVMIPDLPGDNEIKGVYIGNLDIIFLDWNVVIDLVQNNPFVDFIFIGPIDLLKKNEILELVSNDNLIFVDPIDVSLVHSYLDKSDFCLQTYDVEAYPEQLQNSHKTMQYLGSSKPIFSSFTLEYSDDKLLQIYKNRKNVLLKFKEFLDQLPFLSNEENSNYRRNYALDNSYENQIGRIENILNEELHLN